MNRRSATRTAALALSGTLLAACSGAGGGAGGGSADRSVNVLMVNNPQMADLQKLTADHFTKETGIKVNFTVLPENDVRDKISQDFSSQAGQYDVATISNYETPIFAKNGWLAPSPNAPSPTRTSTRPTSCPPSRSPSPPPARSTPSPSTGNPPS